MRTVRTIIKSGSCSSETCVSCGNVQDEVIDENKTAERRAYWKMRTDEEEKEISKEEKISRENEEEALRFGL